MAWTQEGSPRIIRHMENTFWKGNKIFRRDVPVIVSNTTGDVPAFAAHAGTLAYNRFDAKAWMNRDGSTTWVEIDA